MASSALLAPGFIRATGRLKKHTSHNKLVIIQLSGGNDGLNTIVPYNNDIYYQSRPTLAIRPADLLKIDDELAFNKALPNTRGLLDNANMSIINGVGYPNPNRSHFRALDIWQTASDPNEYLQTGWVGRYVDNYCQGTAPAIAVDDGLNLAMKGDTRSGLAVLDPRKFYRTSEAPFFKSLGEAANQEQLDLGNLGFLYKTMIETQESAGYIYEKSRIQRSSVSYPSTPIGNKLKQTAQFINSGLDTTIYYVDHTGFDTHANQLNAQSRILGQYDSALGAFVEDLQQHGSFDNTLVLVFTEFGRRVQENASGGTDHGTANAVYLLGKNLKTPGVVNPYPSLDKLDHNGDLQFSLDFRSIYATIIEDWLEGDATTVLGRPFPRLSLV